MPDDQLQPQGPDGGTGGQRGHSGSAVGGSLPRSALDVQETRASTSLVSFTVS